MTNLTTAQIAALTAIITGSEPKRAASKDDAAKRFIKVAAEHGFGARATEILSYGFEPAKQLVKAAVAETSEPMVAEVAQPLAGPASTADAAVDRALSTYLGSDDRSDAFMRDLFRSLFLEGAAARGKKPAQHKKAQAGETRPGSKKAIVRDLLCRPEGATTAEVLDATGWPTVSMPQQARSCGLTLRTEKDGRVTRYFGSAS